MLLLLPTTPEGNFYTFEETLSFFLSFLSSLSSSSSSYLSLRFWFFFFLSLCVSLSLPTMAIVGGFVAMFSRVFTSVFSGLYYEASDRSFKLLVDVVERLFECNSVNDQWEKQNRSRRRRRRRKDEINSRQTFLMEEKKKDIGQDCMVFDRFVEFVSLKHRNT